MVCICLRCKKSFTPKYHRKKYCSDNCYRPPTYRECKKCGKKFRIKPSALTRNNGSGSFCSNKCNYLFRKTKIKEQANNYKGELAKYAARHMWIKTNFEEKQICEHCGKNKDMVLLEWANISGKYLRERDDWLILCRSCHRKYDHIPGRKNLSLRFKLLLASK